MELYQLKEKDFQLFLKLFYMACHEKHKQKKSFKFSDAEFNGLLIEAIERTAKLCKVQKRLQVGFAILVFQAFSKVWHDGLNEIRQNPIQNPENTPDKRPVLH